jgi:hypothetical protein
MRGCVQNRFIALLIFKARGPHFTVSSSVPAYFGSQREAN